MPVLFPAKMVAGVILASLVGDVAPMSRRIQSGEVVRKLTVNPGHNLDNANSPWIVTLMHSFDSL